MTPEEAKELPWPLVVVETNETPAEHREDTEEYAEAVFNALMAQVRWRALQMLHETGRTGDVRRLELRVYNTKAN